jgi:hypothetical protein
MNQLLSMMAIFIEYPWLAALVAIPFLGLGRWRGRRVAVAAGLAWLLYAVYEVGMKQRWLCSGECNIRIDLLLFYPVLLGLTVAGVVSLLRSGRGRLSSLLLATFFGLSPSLAHAQRQGSPVPGLDCRQPLTLDVATQSVVGVRLDASDSLLEASLPPRSVQRNVESYDDETVITLTITLCGHVLQVGGNGISTTDPAFVTTEGLRVGLPIGRFDQAWGKGQLMSSEAGWVMYYFKKVSINTGVDGCVAFSQTGAQPTVSRDCRVASLWVSTPGRVGAK